MDGMAIWMTMNSEHQRGCFFLFFPTSMLVFLEVGLCGSEPETLLQRLRILRVRWPAPAFSGPRRANLRPPDPDFQLMSAKIQLDSTNCIQLPNLDQKQNRSAELLRSSRSSSSSPSWARFKVQGWACALYSKIPWQIDITEEENTLHLKASL